MRATCSCGGKVESHHSDYYINETYFFAKKTPKESFLLGQSGVYQRPLSCILFFKHAPAIVSEA
jgi:hypothetical protein